MTGTGIRNGPLAQVVTTSTGASPLGVCPAGVTWLVKSVHVFNPTASPAAGHVILTHTTPLVQVALPDFTLEPSTGNTWEGWTTLAPGDSLYLFADVAGLHVWVNGAELPGVKPTHT